MNAVSDEGKVSDEFEEIHSGRRLVLKYPISLCMSIAAVVLDSANTLEGEFTTTCAAMLVPCGKELDWMYSSEGGQWQLLMSAGVSRLILFSRICDADDGLAKMEVGMSSVADKGGRVSKRLRSAEKCPRTLGQAEMEPMAGREKHLISLDHRQESTGMMTESVACWGRRDCAGEMVMVKATEKRKQKYRQRHRCLEQRMEQQDDQVGTRSKRMEEPQPPDKLIRHRSLPSVSSSDPEDEALKCMLASLVLALAPRISFKTGVPNIPFVNYTDNVLQRVVVEEALSPLTGLMRVEDVELEPENSEMDEQIYPIRQTSSSEVPKQEGLSEPTQKHSMKSWRRRLIFRRMPNLIQTEVLLLNLGPTVDRRGGSDRGREAEIVAREQSKCRNHLSQGQLGLLNLETAVRQVDHSRLVHKYLPPIVAGFVLVASCLDACFMSHGRRAQVLSIGVGGGALPIFLQKNFCFHIQVIDLDAGVLQLARKHFGLKEDAYLQVTVGDGLAVVEEIAARAIQEGIVDDRLKQSWTLCLHHSGSDPPLSACQFELPKSAQTTVELFSAPDKGTCGYWLKDADWQSDSDPRKDKAGLVGHELDNDSMLKSPRKELHKQEMRDLSLGPCEVSSSSSNLPLLSYCHQCQNDPRVELIILDVDVDDAQFSLSSPPVSFLEQRFLLSARIALQKGGMLAMNVVPCGEKPYAGVITSLKAVFAEVYEIALKDDVNRVVFALPAPASFNPHLSNGHTVNQVKKVVGDRLIHHIQRLDSIS